MNKLKYAIQPGHVRSKVDGDVHYINARTLMQLYKVDPRECLVIDPKDDARLYEHQTQCAEEQKLIHLRPCFDGNYVLPKPTEIL